jgi:hypothetical protein
MARPKASEQVWHRIFHQGGVEAYEAHDYKDFYIKVLVEGKRPKYFWGETAWVDYQRYASDNIRYSYVV